MAQEEFEIEISRDGKVKVRTKGIKGSRCLDFADLFVQLIGKEESRELTSEYYETDAQASRHIEQRVKR
jgi:Protein of unknown function (DUF2997)